MVFVVAAEDGIVTGAKQGGRSAAFRNQVQR